MGRVSVCDIRKLKKKNKPYKRKNKTRRYLIKRAINKQLLVPKWLPYIMFPNIFAVIFSTTQTKSKTIHKNFNPPPKKRLNTS